MKKGNEVKNRKYLHTPIEPVPVKKRNGVRELLLDMGRASFQGRQMGQALKIWEKMLEEDCFIFLGLAGAMIPAGMRKIIDWLIREGKINCLVSTGANLFHELHETIGYRHYRGHPEMNDVELRNLRIDRIYDTLANDYEFLETDHFIVEFVDESFEQGEIVTTAEYFRRLGEYLKKMGKKGFLVSAFEKKVPIYCPALGDSSYGIAMAAMTDRRIVFDIIKGVKELGEIILANPLTGVVYLGGGTPKNFIQQSEIVAMEMVRHASQAGKVNKYRRKEFGHRYAIQISTDAPHWGGLSGCPLEEGQSWGKEHEEAEMVNLYCDVTIALPILANALAESPVKRKRK